MILESKEISIINYYINYIYFIYFYIHAYILNDNLVQCFKVMLESVCET